MSTFKHSMLGIYCVCMYTFLLASVTLASEDNTLLVSTADRTELAELGQDPRSYRTPRAGEGFKTQVFGEEVTIPARSLAAVTGWKLGAQFETPKPDDRLALPAAALYLWRQPDERHWLRGELAGVYNNVFWGVKPENWGDFELGLTFTNFTLPSTWNEVYDGVRDEREEMFWGYVRPGFSVGYPKSLATGRQDNMWQLNYVLEPGYFYSARDELTAANMVLPKSTFELRNRVNFRYDNLERNILSLPHQGLAAGAEIIQGYRAHWADWGTPENTSRKHDGQHYVNFNAYAVSTNNVPFVSSERHKLVSWLTAGVGHNLDRFSATRVGGGPNAMGMEYGSSAMPILPGTSIWEFYPDHYAIGALEYRYELSWFTYLTAHGGVGYLNPLRPHGANGLRESKELLPWMGTRLTTGFFFDTLLQIDYSHSFNLVNAGTRGGNEIMFWLSGEFN